MWEVVVIGAGPAGLSAGLTLGRMRRRTLIVDSGEPRNAPSPAVHNFFSRDGIPPADLRAIGREQLAPYRDVRVLDASVTGVRPISVDGFEVAFADGDAVGAQRILLATGIRDEMPPVEGLDALWGRQALHCPYCHGFEVADSPLAVLGATEHRVRHALHLTRLSHDVVLCTNGVELPDQETRAKLQAHGVKIEEAPIMRVQSEEPERIRLFLGDGRELDRRAIFVQSRISQRSFLAEEFGCRLFEDGTVEVDEAFRTSVPGVYAAGDMARRTTMPGPAAAVAAAAAAGAVVAAMIDQDLVSAEFGLPHPF